MDLEHISYIHDPRFVSVHRGYTFRYPFGHYIIMVDTLECAVMTICGKKLPETRVTRDETYWKSRAQLWRKDIPSKVLVYDGSLPSSGELLKSHSGQFHASVALSDTGSTALVLHTGEPPSVFLENDKAILYHIRDMNDFSYRHGLIRVNDPPHE